jgi:hypothetical protein
LIIYTTMYKVYLIKNVDEEQYKIGYTRREVQQRLKEFKTGNCNELKIVSVYESEWGTKIEANLHRRYRRNKINGEWFELTKKEEEEFLENCKNLHETFSLLNENNSYVIEKGFR